MTHDASPLHCHAQIIGTDSQCATGCVCSPRAREHAVPADMTSPVTSAIARRYPEYASAHLLPTILPHAIPHAANCSRGCRAVSDGRQASMAVFSIQGSPEE